MNLLNIVMYLSACGIVAAFMLHLALDIMKQSGKNF